MNKIFNLKWSETQQQWVVANERVKAKKKLKGKRLLLACLTTTISSVVLASPAPRALPSLNNIAAGNATLVTATGSLTVNQNTSKLIANWNSFDVGASAKVTFNQPDTNSMVLNRISSGAASEIFGRVTANGKLILVNPAGLTFGAGSQVSAASVIASTLNISDANLNADNLLFERGSIAGEINNHGSVLSLDGNTSLLAPVIRNTGIVRSINGNVTLANGNKLTVDNTSVVLNQASSVAGLIQSSGVLRADRLDTTKGKIYLVGDRARAGSKVQLQGDLTAISADIKGKSIEVTGDINSIANTSLNAVDDVYINGSLNINSNNRLVSLTHAASGGYYLGESGKINLSGVNTKFRVNGEYFKIIKTLAELQAIGSSTAKLADHYVIGLDIDATSTATTSFTPIGSTSTTVFTGSLNGLGHKISNLTINKPVENNVGLIGYAKGARLENLKLVNLSVTGNAYVGGLIGYNLNDANNDIANLTGYTTLFNNQVSGGISGYSYVGGIIGYSEGINQGGLFVYNNRGNLNVVGDLQFVGGLIGYSRNNKANLVIDGSSLNTTVQFSNLSLNGTIKNSIGGMVGEISSGDNSSILISNNQLATNVSSPRATYTMGGLIGKISTGDNTAVGFYNTSVTGSINTYTANNSQSSRTGGFAGEINRQSATSVVNIQGVSGTADVSGGGDVGGLIGRAIGTNVENSFSTGHVNAAGANAGGLLGYSSTNEVKGSYAHGNVNATGTYSGGLIGNSTSDVVENSYASGSVNGFTYVGGLIGNSSSGAVQNSYASGVVSASQSYAGGLIGYINTTSIEGSYASGAVSAVQSYTGGLVGYFVNGNIKNSYASGSINGTSYLGSLIGYLYHNTGNMYLTNNYASGQVTGSTSKGGLIGQAYDAGGVSNATGNYWDKTGTGINVGIGSGGISRSPQITGLTSTQMKQLNSFINWDISNQLNGSTSVWYIQEGVSTPQLRALLVH